jgi:hypothetical protein
VIDCGTYGTEGSLVVGPEDIRADREPFEAEPLGELAGALVALAENPACPRDARMPRLVFSPRRTSDGHRIMPSMGQRDDDIMVVTEAVAISALKVLAEQRFGDMVKAVVDVEIEVMAIGGELHADEESVLLDEGSGQGDLWGINLYPDQFPDEDWLEVDSMINIRPAQGNRSRSVDDPKIQKRIRAVVARLVRSDE